MNSEPCALSQRFHLFIAVGKRKPKCNLQAVYDAVVTTRECEHANCASQRLLIRLHGKVERVAAYVNERQELNICDAGEPWMGVPTDTRIVFGINLVEWRFEERASLRQIHPRPMRNPFQAWPKRALHSGDPSALMIDVLLVDRRIRRDSRIRILKRNDLIREAQLFNLRMMRDQSPTV